MKVYSDGGARGNPGPAAIGFLVIQGDDVIHKEGKYIGEQTNNKAEYTAIIEALSWCLKNNFREDVKCYLDSQLVVKQINGEFKVKNENIKSEYKTLLELSRKFEKIEFNYIPRNQNKKADALVNIALDTYL